MPKIKTMKRLIPVLVFLIIPAALYAQTGTSGSITQSVYLIGNTSQEIQGDALTQLRTWFTNTKEEFTVLHLGDIIGGKNDSVKLKELVSLVNGAPNGKIYFIPGDKDWDNSHRNGWEAVKKLEKQVTAVSGQEKMFLTSSGCPGPEVLDLPGNVRIIAINSQWWMHPYSKPTSADNECKCRTEQDFLDELQDIIGDSEGKNILIAAHHPVLSYGNYGGRIPLKRHLFPFPESTGLQNVPMPVLGTIYAAYRQNVGTPRDMAYPAYERYIKGMENIFLRNSDIIYASSHEYNLQLNYMGGNYHVISGSLVKRETVGKGVETLFSKSDKGFSKLEYYSDGSIMLRFFHFTKNGIEELWSQMLFQSPCAATQIANVPVNGHGAPCMQQSAGPVSSTQGKYATFIAGPEYKAGSFKKVMLGERYRSAWEKQVKAPYLDLRNTYGGLHPYEKGGGRQTLSLKFKAGNGEEYVFRSVDKDFTRTLAPKLRNTIFEPILRDVTSTQHPYGALAVSRMLDATDIMHAQPQLFVLPDDTALGPFRKEFANMPGFLEDKPVGSDKGEQGFNGADKVSQSVDMFRKLYADNDNRVAVENLGKARVFDMLIGDWGRHQDNFKWAGFKQEKGMIYYPIPRDRDHAFSRWNGILPWFADRPTAIPFVEDFEYDVDGVRSLNYNARHLDRFLLSSLDREDWQQLAKYIQSTITDAVIDSAMAAMPAEVRDMAVNEIALKLKTRRMHLTEIVDKYYEDLAKQVDVTGSNKAEYFDVERLANGNVRVRVWANRDNSITQPAGTPFYEREFTRHDTREINIYGLDGDDIFVVRGSSSNSILVRIIGGEGNDKITDNSQVHGMCKYTWAYDVSKTDLSKGKETKDMRSNSFNINSYDRQAFKYSMLKPFTGVFYRRDDGIGLLYGYRFTKHGFREDGYKSQHEIKLTASSNSNLYLNYESDWHHVLCKWDINTRINAGHYFPTLSYYGYGNNTVKNDTLYDSGYYHVFDKGVNAGIFLERQFFKFSSFHIGPVYEMNELRNKKEILITPEQVHGIGSVPLAGVESGLDLDLRDRKTVATRGLRLAGYYSEFYNFSREDHFGIAEAFLKYYATAKFRFPVTLAAEIGGSKNYGDIDNIPLYKAVYLGQKHHLRGYVRHRFTGDQTAYFNTELRLNFGRIENQFIPFYFGLIGFKDYGKVWYKGKTGDWHQSIGGGFFIAPISTSVTMYMMFEHSPEERMLLDIGAGFYIDK